MARAQSLKGDGVKMAWTFHFWAMVIMLTTFSFAMVFMFGTRPLAIALVWMITRVPGHSGSDCPVYYLDPMGPWPGVCEKACKNRIGAMGVSQIEACYFMSGQTRKEDYEEKKGSS